MTSTTSTFLSNFHSTILESEKPTKLYSLPLGKQRLWCEVPLRYLKMHITVLKWESLGEA